MDIVQLILIFAEFDAFETKMRDENLSQAFITSFKMSYDALVAGATGCIAESDISPASDLPVLSEIKASGTNSDSGLLAKTVMLKLNGGLGTGMGLDKAKSLLEVNIFSFSSGVCLFHLVT